MTPFSTTMNISTYTWKHENTANHSLYVTICQKHNIHVAFTFVFFCIIDLIIYTQNNRPVLHHCCHFCSNIFQLYLYLRMVVILSVCLVAIEIHTDAFEKSTISIAIVLFTRRDITYILRINNKSLRVKTGQNGPL